MAKSFKPMLAGKLEGDPVLPCMVSNKLDGVRAIVIDGVLMSRTLKPIPNAWCQRMFGGLPNGTDGELILGDPTDKDVYRKTVSAVMSEDGEPFDVWYRVFDNYTYSGGFKKRYDQLVKAMCFRPHVELVVHVFVDKIEHFNVLEDGAVLGGFEGVMIRSLDGPYKFGRSTSKEGYLLKCKRFTDMDAEVTGTYEWETNNNEAKTNALGRTERSTHQENKVGAGVLGGLLVRGLEAPYKDVEFSVGTGFAGADDPNGERAKLWANRKTLPGRIVKVKYFASGSKDKPRFPVFLGWRDPIDRD
jgi:DNA ligase 1